MTKIISKELLSLFNENCIDFKENENVAAHSSFKIGGNVRLALYPDSNEKLMCALDALASEGIRYEIIGNASNVLFAFDEFDGAMIFTSKICGATFEKNTVKALCGTSLTYLSNMAAQRALTGLEFAYGIPGLVGGSVYMNAGAYGSSISEILSSTVAYDTKNRKLVDITEHGFGYRRSIYMDDPSLVCLEAKFTLANGDENAIRAKMQENMASRKDKQPLEFASAGSYFKRPEGNFAGKLIEDCGLKGMRVGDAEVSHKHAGFIINKGNATAVQVLELEEKIKERVENQFGVILQREVRLIK